MATAAATSGDTTMEVDEIWSLSVDGGTGELSDDNITKNGKDDAALGDAEERLTS